MVDKILEDIFPDKQMSEHAKIINTDNTEDLREKSEAGKTTEERDFTVSRKSYNSSRMYCDYMCSRVTLSPPPFFLKKKGYLYFGR